jgi:hypothetical protein
MSRHCLTLAILAFATTAEIRGLGFVTAPTSPNAVTSGCTIRIGLGQTYQQPQICARMAFQPSQTIRGRTARAANGSAHFRCQIALIAGPARAINQR